MCELGDHKANIPPIVSPAFEHQTSGQKQTGGSEWGAKFARTTARHQEFSTWLRDRVTVGDRLVVRAAKNFTARGLGRGDPGHPPRSGSGGSTVAVTNVRHHQVMHH